MDAQEVILTLTPLPPPGEVAVGLSKRRLFSPLLQRTISLSTRSPDTSYVILGRSSHNVTKKLVPAAENAYFDSPNISRQHATIFIDSSRSRVMKIRDTGSLHGTYRFGERVPRDGIVLYDQDTINLGTKIIYDGDIIPPQRILVNIRWLPVSSLLKAVTAPVSGFGIHELSNSEAELTVAGILDDGISSAAPSPSPSYQDGINSLDIVDDRDSKQPSACIPTETSEFAGQSLQVNDTASDIWQPPIKTDVEADQACPPQVENQDGRVTSWIKPLLMGFAASPTYAETLNDNEESLPNESNVQNEPEHVIDVQDDAEIEQQREETITQVEERKGSSVVVADDLSAIEESEVAEEITHGANKPEDELNSSIEIIDLLSSSPVACQPQEQVSNETGSRESIEICDDQLCDAIVTDEPTSEPVLKPEDSSEPVDAKRRFSDIDDFSDEEIDNSQWDVASSKRRRLESSLPPAGEGSPSSHSSLSSAALIGRYAAATAVGLVIGSVSTFTALLLSDIE
ncbi:hypothetical protein V1525DRAFT_399746 [Lipomyces kononenkoae]|uniref:Uncharacterized protein n=1 Tax=Lipomyces kononenkoae TaxID=34357 RepID=A0ACC3T4L9_LIPKO